MTNRPVRFAPAPSDHAILSFSPDAAFQADGQALITDQTPGAGCGLVLFANPKIFVGARLKVQLGRDDPVLAQVVWTKAIPPGLVQVGMKFLK